ncbi:MAG TPA: hypothetical protein VMD02_02510, partial [Candidatus Omnitrophota bacterium]|nr:hypothetical protein [Candidatus Omnitrophota bacterium]
LIFIAYFWLNRALADFIKCAFLINRTYLAASPSPVFFIDPRYGLDSIFKIMASDNGPLWVLSIFAAILFLFGKKGKDRLLLVIWGILSFVGMASGSLFFGHYYIQLVPALCLLSAGMLLNWKEIKTPAVRVLAAAALLLLLCINLISLYPFYFFYTPNQISIQQYRTSDFVVSRVVANELAKLMRPGDRVFVWSAQPEIYFYLGQKAPSRYFYYIYWMKDPRPFGEFIPDAMLRGLMEESPRFIVRGNYSPPAPRLADWIMKNYNLRDELSGWKIGKMGWLIGERKR